MDVFQTYGKPLHRYLMRQLANSQSARDLAQETYLRLLRVERIELVKFPQAYLFRIASNLVYELRAREQRDPVTFDSRLVDYCAGRISNPDCIEPGEQLNLDQQLETIFRSLRPLHAAILLLRKRDGLSLEEVAARLDISTHTVKKYLSQAIAQIRLQGLPRP